jgi:alpha-galactosidase
MLGRTAMTSFSDAHELPEIPIIAANLHRLILPRQSQIWAVLRKTDSRRRLIYSLAATFLGRMCLSGEIGLLTLSQWQDVENAIDLYRHAAPIIKAGTSRKYGELGKTWRYPQGWQAMIRTSLNANQALVVIHTFKEAPKTINLPWCDGAWQKIGQISDREETEPQFRSGKLIVTTGGDFGGTVFLLQKGFH